MNSRDWSVFMLSTGGFLSSRVTPGNGVLGLMRNKSLGGVLEQKCVCHWKQQEASRYLLKTPPPVLSLICVYASSVDA